jgi:hypothetical protein
MEEKVRLIRHEFVRPTARLWALIHFYQAKRELGQQALKLPERDRARLRVILDIRPPAILHKWAQRTFAWELALRARGSQRLPAAVCVVRIALMRMSERRYRTIVENEFGAGFRGLAMQRVAEMVLLTRGWVPEVDDLLLGARWRTRHGWQGAQEEDQAHYLSIPEGLRQLFLGDIKRARMNLWRTYHYYAERRDLSGQAQSLLYLALVYLKLGRPRTVRVILRAIRRLRKRYR